MMVINDCQDWCSANTQTLLQTGLVVHKCYLLYNEFSWRQLFVIHVPGFTTTISSVSKLIQTAISDARNVFHTPIHVALDSLSLSCVFEIKIRWTKMVMQTRKDEERRGRIPDLESAEKYRMMISTPWSFIIMNEWIILIPFVFSWLHNNSGKKVYSFSNKLAQWGQRLSTFPTAGVAYKWQLCWKR